MERTTIASVHWHLRCWLGYSFISLSSGLLWYIISVRTCPIHQDGFSRKIFNFWRSQTQSDVKGQAHYKTIHLPVFLWPLLYDKKGVPNPIGGSCWMIGAGPQWSRVVVGRVVMVDKGPVLTNRAPPDPESRCYASTRCRQQPACYTVFFFFFVVTSPPSNPLAVIICREDDSREQDRAE